MGSDTIDHRAKLPPARDQGARPTCLSFALSDAHAFALGSNDLMSPEYLHYHAAVAAGGSPAKGIDLTAARRALLTTGQPLERDCPYLPVHDPTWTPPSGRRVWRRSSTVELKNPSRLVADGVRNGCAPILVFRVSRSFFSPDAQTHVVTNDTSADPRRHAVVVLGLSSSVLPELAFLVRNSWGPRWGLEGHAWLSASYVDARADGIVNLDTSKDGNAS